MPEISILMNCYNGAEYLKFAIDSIYAQTFKDWEIVFIDNQSTDGSAAIAKSYDDRLKYYRTPEFLPLGGARSFGLDFCKSKYLAFLDTDDIYLPEKLEEQYSFMEEKQLDLSYTGFQVMDEKGDLGKKYYPTGSGDFFAFLLIKYEINMQSVMLRNTAKIKFDPQFEYSPDAALFLDIAVDGKVGNLRDVLVQYRVVSNSLSAKTVALWGREARAGLDKLIKLYPGIEYKYPKEFSLARGRADYLSARYYMEAMNNRREAELLMRKNRQQSTKMHFFYLLSLLPSPLWNLVHRICSSIEIRQVK
ncbi:MAG: glycosyltransferase [Desulfuromusa sp.]|nr:glycosyltransferase [Desulfuromusa sp.]